MLELFDYQETALAALRAGFIEGHQAQMLVLPTGGGKTETAIALLEACADRGNRAAMILDRRVLCDQTSQRLDKYGIDHGVIMANHWRYRPDRRIQVCSAQTLERKESFPGLKLLIIDEAHTTRKMTMQFVKNNPGIKVVGLSATPFTKGLGSVYTNVVSTITTSDLVDNGRLCPVRVYVSKEIDMDGAKVVAGDWAKDDMESRGMKITGDIVSEWVKKTHEIYGGPRKTIVFSSSIAHGRDLSEKFAQAGYNFVCITSDDLDDFKQDVIADFGKPDTQINGLIAVDILTKGFDVPDVCIGVSARPFRKSLSSHIQQMGRIMRCHPSKEFAVWLDHAGNYLRFQDEWEDVFANGVTRLDEDKDKPKKEKTKAEKDAAKCPMCSRLWPKNSDTCPSCGHVRMKRNTVEEVPGEMVEIDGKKTKETMAKKQAFYSQLLYISREKGYKQGWISNKYKDKFGVWPKGMEDYPLPPTPEVKGWIVSQQIRWAKSNKEGR